MLTRFALLAVLGLALSFGACNGKAAAERESLIQQKAEFMAQRDAERAARADADARVTAFANTPSTSSQHIIHAPPMTEPDAGVDVAGTTDLGSGIKVDTNEFGQRVIHIPSDVLFDSGKAALKPAAKKSLDKVAAIIKKDYKGQLLRVEGHTDPNPVRRSGWDDNWDLGAARAHAVLLYLIEKGVPKKDMYMASFADNKLKSTAAKDFALNRRVDIVVTGGR